MLLEGKVVVITGVGSGVGRASALLFAREGARVVGGDVREDWGKETLRLIGEDRGRDCSFVSCDVTCEEDVRELIEAAVSEHGRLDVMMNNVGISTPRPGLTRVPMVPHRRGRLGSRIKSASVVGGREGEPTGPDRMLHDTLPQRIGSWTVTSLVPSGKVASTCTSWIISAMPSMT